MQERQVQSDGAIAEVSGGEALPVEAADDRDLHARLAERDLDTRLSQIARTGRAETPNRFKRR